MWKVLRRRPSASIVVAMAALVLSASGTAVAASSLVSGDKLIKKHSLSGNRLRSHTITKTQINMSKLGTVPKANVANYATSAGSASSATNAGNASTLGGQSPSAFEQASKIVRFVVKATAGQTVPILSAGSLSLSFVCGHNTTDPNGNAGRDFGAIEIATSQNGALFDSSASSAGGTSATDYLNTNTSEQNRLFQINSQTTGNSKYQNDYDGGVAIAPDGSSVSLSNEGTGIGVNVLGSACVANGYAVIES